LPRKGYLPKVAPYEFDELVLLVLATREIHKEKVADIEIGREIETMI
jgi:hypothetical protein